MTTNSRANRANTGVSGLDAGSVGVAVRDYHHVDAYGLSDSDQARANQIIAELEREAHDGPTPLRSPFLDETRFPSMPAWMGLRKSALALHPLYRAGALSRLAEGLPGDVFTAPILDGHAAEEVLRRTVSPGRADRIIERHRAFTSTEISPIARLMLAGSMDAKAIRARAAAAAWMIRGHLADGRRAIRLASVACGAAGPIAEAGACLDAEGIEVIDATLLDRDPMALAAGTAVARSVLPGATVHPRLVDLIDGTRRTALELKPLSGPGWDIIDILGLFEYLPDAFASDLVRSALAATVPGGVIVVANMLDVRPQQRFFKRVAQWPSVIQRPCREFVELLIRAGATSSQITVVVPADSPVYAVAAIRSTR